MSHCPYCFAPEYRTHGLDCPNRQGRPECPNCLSWSGHRAFCRFAEIPLPTCAWNAGCYIRRTLNSKYCVRHKGIARNMALRHQADRQYFRGYSRSRGVGGVW